MIRLWRWFSLRHLWSYKGRALLCLLGVALGVAVFVGIKTAASSAMISFRDTVTSLTGTTPLQVRGQANGFPEEFYAMVASSDGVLAATPVLEFNVIAAPPIAEPLLMLGIDVFSDQEFRQYHFVQSQEGPAAILSFLTEPGAIALTEKFANRHELIVGDQVEVLSGSRQLTLTLRALLKLKGPARALEGNVALVDIATAQEAFDRIGRLDRIDLIFKTGVVQVMRHGWRASARVSAVLIKVVKVVVAVVRRFTFHGRLRGFRCFAGKRAVRNAFQPELLGVMIQYVVDDFGGNHQFGVGRDKGPDTLENRFNISDELGIILAAV